MPKRQPTKKPPRPQLKGLLSADELRWELTTKTFPADKYTDALIAAKLKISDGFAGMILSGTRAPSVKFLKAIGMERVVFYRKVAK